MTLTTEERRPGQGTASKMSDAVLDHEDTDAPSAEASAAAVTSAQTDDDLHALVQARAEAFTAEAGERR